MTDDDLAPFVAATREHLDHGLAAAAPDFPASVARAREIDPEAVPARALDDAAALAPVVQLRPSSRPSPRAREGASDRIVLAPFAAELRRQLEEDLARRIHRAAIAGGAAAPMAVTPPVAPPRRRPALVASLALAAAVLLAFGLRGALVARQGTDTPDAALAGLRDADGSEALAREPGLQHTVQPVPTDSPDEPVPADSSPGASDSLSTPADSSPAPTDSLEGPVPADSSPVSSNRTTGPRSESPSPRRPGKPRPTPAPAAPAAPDAEDPLAALDREAQARWQAGDLRGAADRFREVIARAPGSRAAETAYGDLFALERRLGGDAVGLWRAYLREFPTGRYADDARAGICRREPAEQRPACWDAYLADHPAGAHRREAEQSGGATPRDP